jgi:hypothetical protein
MASPLGPREPAELRNPQLTDALQTADIAAIAFALRHGPTVVPLAPAEPDVETAERVWMHRDDDAGPATLLLFSDAAFRPSTVPADAIAASPVWLRDYLVTHRSEIGSVFIDFAGPHPMRAAPEDIIAALDA